MNYVELINNLKSLKGEYEAEMEEGIEKPELKTISEALAAIERLTEGRGPKRTIAIGILDMFENLLEENDITIPDKEREGNEEEARLYGDSYYSLEDGIVAILDEYIKNPVDDEGNEITE